MLLSKFGTNIKTGIKVFMQYFMEKYETMKEIILKSMLPKKHILVLNIKIDFNFQSQHPGQYSMVPLTHKSTY